MNFSLEVIIFITYNIYLQIFQIFFMILWKIRGAFDTIV